MTGDSAAPQPERGGRSRRRYQVRGPHGATGDYARWTVVDTADRDIAVHTARTKSEASATARELNAAASGADTLHRKDT